jgi:hypothetical protein
MPHVTVTIDNQQLLNDNLDDWHHQTQPPDFIRQHATQPAKAEPWIKAIMVALAEAAITNTAINIEVGTNPKGWAMLVEYP